MANTWTAVVSLCINVVLAFAWSYYFLETKQLEKELRRKRQDCHELQEELDGMRVQMQVYMRGTELKTMPEEEKKRKPPSKKQINAAIREMRNWSDELDGE